jgi:hypothetical protein
VEVTVERDGRTVLAVVRYRSPVRLPLGGRRVRVLDLRAQVRALDEGG